MSPRLLIASNNPGKVLEFRALLAGIGWDIVGPADVGVTVEVEETGSTYHENARIKAEAFGRAANLPSLADDSGLEVDTLDGAPGALHHINGWDGQDNAERIAILLGALRASNDPSRSGRYRAVITVWFPDGSTLEEEGSCEGEIIDTPKGTNGFGYDPVFFLPERGLTMAQLSPEDKNAISHRGIAVAKMRERLRELADRESGDGADTPDWKSGA